MSFPVFRPSWSILTPEPNLSTDPCRRTCIEDTSRGRSYHRSGSEHGLYKAEHCWMMIVTYRRMRVPMVGKYRRLHVNRCSGCLGFSYYQKCHTQSLDRS